MPYVAQDHRDNVLPNIVALVYEVRSLPAEKQAGVLNYVISEIVSRTLRPAEGWNYASIHNAHGVFLDAAAEFYRRVAGPYEDKARVKNGDLWAYQPQQFQ